MTTQQVYRRPCKVISLKEKLAILKQFESGSSRREIEEIFKCSQSTISRILVSKDSILQEAQNCNGDRRENLTANNYAYKELYKSLTKWAKDMKQIDGEITAHVARKKAEELSRNMGQELSPSNAWLYRWKERENVVFVKKPKEPEKYVKESLDKQMKPKTDTENVYKETCESHKLNNEETRLPISETFKKNIIQYRPPPKSFTSIRNNCNKLRTRRKYIKRPIVDASGLICKSRKVKTFLTMLQKLELLQRLKNGERRTDLIIEYNLSQSAISQIVSEEEKILNVVAKGQNLQLKRIRGGIFRDGEAELNSWVLQRMAKGESLTRKQIIKRAKEIAERLNIDFKASTGWLEKWKTRMNMDFNENRVLHRKVTQYIADDPDSNKSLDKEQLDVIYEHFECQEIKQEMDVCNYNTDMDASHEELNCEIKTEELTPQQFYMQTIANDLLAEQRSKELQEKHEKLVEDMKKKESELENNDIKPCTASPSSSETSTQIREVLQDTSTNPKEKHIIEEKNTEEDEINNIIIKPKPEKSLHDEVHNWLNFHNIEPLAAEKLLEILRRHLDKEINLNSTN